MVAYQWWDCAWRWSCRGGQWNSGGNCDGETRPITNETQLSPYPWMMRTLESVIAEMITPVLYLNITKMTDYRKDGHPSIFRQPEASRSNEMVQDCSHWCLPGVPDSWNELLYATLLTSSCARGVIAGFQWRIDLYCINSLWFSWSLYVSNFLVFNSYFLTASWQIHSMHLESYF